MSMLWLIPCVQTGSCSVKYHSHLPHTIQGKYGCETFPV